MPDKGITVNTNVCADLPAGAMCITGMIYTGCMDSSCWNENCTYLGNCTDPRHENKEK